MDLLIMPDHKGKQPRSIWALLIKNSLFYNLIADGDLWPPSILMPEFTRKETKKKEAVPFIQPLRLVILVNHK